MLGGLILPLPQRRRQTRRRNLFCCTNATPRAVPLIGRFYPLSFSFSLSCSQPLSLFITLPLSLSCPTLSLSLSPSLSFHFSLLLVPSLVLSFIPATSLSLACSRLSLSYTLPSVPLTYIIASVLFSYLPSSLSFSLTLSVLLFLSLLLFLYPLLLYLCPGIAFSPFLNLFLSLPLSIYCQSFSSLSCPPPLLTVSVSSLGSKL